jgi:hypothetical protein
MLRGAVVRNASSVFFAQGLFRATPIALAKTEGLRLLDMSITDGVITMRMCAPEQAPSEILGSAPRVSALNTPVLQTQPQPMEIEAEEEFTNEESLEEVPTRAYEKEVHVNGHSETTPKHTGRSSSALGADPLDTALALYPKVKVPIDGRTVAARQAMAFCLAHKKNGRKVSLTDYMEFLRFNGISSLNWKSNSSVTGTGAIEGGYFVVSSEGSAKLRRMWITYVEAALTELSSFRTFLEGLLDEGTISSEYAKYTLAGVMLSDRIPIRIMVEAMRAGGVSTGNYAASLGRRVLRFVAFRSADTLHRSLAPQQMAILQSFEDRLKKELDRVRAAVKGSLSGEMTPYSSPLGLLPLQSSPAIDNEGDLDEAKEANDDVEASEGAGDIEKNGDDEAGDEEMSPVERKAERRSRKSSEASMKDYFALAPPEAGLSDECDIIVFLPKSVTGHDADSRRNVLYYHLLANRVLKKEVEMTHVQAQRYLARFGLHKLALPRDIMKDPRFDWTTGHVKLAKWYPSEIPDFVNADASRDNSTKMLEILPIVRKLLVKRPPFIMKSALTAKLSENGIVMNVIRDLPRHYIYPVGSVLVISPFYYRDLQP